MITETLLALIFMSISGTLYSVHRPSKRITLLVHVISHMKVELKTNLLEISSVSIIIIIMVSDIDGF